jgi:hypothetical protein
LEGDSADVGVELGVGPPSVELHLPREELPTAVALPVSFRTVLSHLENIPPKLAKLKSN